MENLRIFFYIVGYFFMNFNVVFNLFVLFFVIFMLNYLLNLVVINYGFVIRYRFVISEFIMLFVYIIWGLL